MKEADMDDLKIKGGFKTPLKAELSNKTVKCGVSFNKGELVINLPKYFPESYLVEPEKPINNIKIQINWHSELGLIPEPPPILPGTKLVKKTVKCDMFVTDDSWHIDLPQELIGILLKTGSDINEE